MELIGKKLEDVINYFESNNIKYTILDNNFSVKGDTKLVTNIIANDEGYTVITGDFIFDLRKQISEEQ